MIKIYKAIQKIPVILFTLTFSVGALAANPDYIEAVKLDINEFETKIFQEQPNSPWLPSGKKARVDGSDSLESFNDFLSKRFPGSFILFSKLEKTDQEQVWQNYVKTGDLGGIRSDIYTLRRKNAQQR
jgi:hypothetical protein